MEKYKVIKEFAGIEVGTEMSVRNDKLKYMIESGYIESIKPQFTPQNKAELKPRKNKRNGNN